MMRIGIKHLGAILVGILGALAAGCGETAPEAPLILASVYNVTGPQAVLDVPSSHGSLLAVSAINAEGGVLGRELKLIQVEGDTVPETLASATETLLEENDEIVALLGLSDTDMVLAAAPVAARHDRVFLSSGATSPELPQRIPEYLFLACFGDNVQAAAGAEWAFNELGARAAAVLFDPDESYTRLLQGYFVERFKGLGGTIIASENIHPRAERITLPPIDNVDLVFLSVETAEDAGRVIPLLRASGYAGPILGGDGYDASSTWAGLPGIADVYFTTHVYLGTDSPNPEVREFLDAYTTAYPGESPSAFAALGFDAVNLLAAALERAGEPSPSVVTTGLSRLAGHRGLTGTIAYQAGARIPTKSVTILRIVDAKQRFVAEVIPTGVPDP